MKIRRGENLQRSTRGYCQPRPLLKALKKPLDSSDRESLVRGEEVRGQGDSLKCTRERGEFPGNNKNSGSDGT